MKYSIGVFVACSLLSASAQAGSVSVEYIQGNFFQGREASADSKLLDVEVWHTIYLADAAFELQTEPRTGQSLVTVKVGKSNRYHAVDILPYAELGRKIGNVGDVNVFGYGIKADFSLSEKIPAWLGYKHRNDMLPQPKPGSPASVYAYTAARSFVTNMYSIGLGYSFSSKTSVGATWYKTYGSDHDESVGISVTREF